MKKILNIGSAELRFTDGEQDFVLSLVGLSPRTITHLALLGAASVLERRKDKLAGIKDLRAGIVGRRPRANYAPIIRAVAKAYDIPLPDAESAWKGADKALKRQMRSSAAVKRELLALEYENLSGVESSLPELPKSGKNLSPGEEV